MFLLPHVAYSLSVEKDAKQILVLIINYKCDGCCEGKMLLAMTV